MKILLSIITLIALIFLLGCSKIDTGNISKKELENLANKYGGIYIFNKKYYDEIEKREKEREEFYQKNNTIKVYGEASIEEDHQIFDKIDNQLPQILSNGKKYYKDGMSEEISKSCYKKIFNYIGEENLNKYEPWIFSNWYYKDDNNDIIPISCTAIYEYIETSYGLFGDEGAGFSFSKNKFKSVKGKNKIYLDKL